jgi:hypothetical protein
VGCCNLHCTSVVYIIARIVFPNLLFVIVYVIMYYCCSVLSCGGVGNDDCLFGVGGND